MQKTRVIAEDSKEALALIAREIGPDAVILSTRRVNGGIEIIAGHHRRGDQDASAAAVAAPAGAGAKPLGGSAFATMLARQTRPDRTGAHDLVREPGGSSQVSAIYDTIQEIRELLTSDVLVGELPKDPRQRNAYLSLRIAGIPQAAIAEFLAGAELDEQTPTEAAFAAFLAARLIDEQAMPKQGAVAVATVGASGTGKTSVLAQLAAQARLQDPDRMVVFVNTDVSRIGAGDEIRVLGRILNVPVIDATDEGTLGSLTRHTDPRLSLFFDMPSERDKCRRFLDVLKARHENLPKLRVFLTVPSSLSCEATEALIAAFPAASGVAISKLGECGPTASFLARLALAGRRVSFLSQRPDLLKGLAAADLDVLKVLVERGFARQPRSLQ